MPKTAYLETVVLDHVLRSVTYASPSAVYLGLFTSSPSPTDPGIEVTGGSYTRQLVTFSAPTSGSVHNLADVTYAIATAPWGTIGSFGIFDAPLMGNLLYYGALTAPREVLVNDQIRFPTSQILVSEQ
jgi:hypothetical protein